MIDETAERTTSYAIDTSRGRFAIRAGERHLPPLIYSTGHPRSRQFRLFEQAGVSLASFPATCDFHLYDLAGTVWTAPGTWDYTALDARIEQVLAGNPDALLLPRVFTCSPVWWDEAHPQELVVWHDGSKDLPLRHGARKHCVPSLASTAWRRARAENLRRFVRHLEDGPHGARVAGYLVTSGNTEEWIHWGTQEGYLFDYGQPAQQAFRRWLAERYGDDDALARAWGRSVTLEDACVPPADRRRPGAALDLLDPARDRDVLDHRLFLADLTARSITDLAALVKRETDGRKLFGCFYGYLLELAWHHGGFARSGHLGLRRVLDCPDVDFLASPTSYVRRFVGDGVSLSMAPVGSVLRAGKAFFHENDVRTHMVREDAGYGRTDDRFQTGTVQRRELAWALTQGLGSWWFDMTGGWFDDPATQQDIAEIVAIARRAMAFPHESAAEIALVVDDASLVHASAPPHQMVPLHARPALDLFSVGAPFEVLLLDDLLAGGQRFRFVLLPSLFAADAARARDLHARLAAWNATALFCVAPGLVPDGLEGARRLTGLPLAEALHPEALRIAAPGGTTYGSRGWWRTPLTCGEEEAEVLGRYAGSGLPGLLRASQDGWTAVYSGAPSPPPTLLRRLARDAGVPLFLETGDQVLASRHFLALHAATSGVKPIADLETEVLYDLRHQVEVTRDQNGRFPLWLARGETALLFRGRRDQWHGV